MQSGKWPMMYKGNKLTIIDEQRRRYIIHDFHEGLGDNAKAIALSSHLGKTSTYQTMTSRFYWYTIVTDVAEYIKSIKCQRHLAILNNVKHELKSIPVSSNVMKQIGVDLCSLPKVDEFKHVLVCIYYFFKWLKAKPTCDKSVPTVAPFLYELICKGGCFVIQINGSRGKWSFLGQ